MKLILILSIISTAASILFQRTTGNAVVGAIVSNLQLLILYGVTFFRLRNSNVRVPKNTNLLVLSFAIADLAYGLGVDVLGLPLPNKMGCLFYIVPYLIGMGGVTYFSLRAFKKLNDKPLIFFSSIVFLIVFYISTKTIVIPALTTKVPPLPSLLQGLTVIFTVFESAVIAVSATLLLITFSIPFQLALFGLLLMHISDIAMRYQSVDTTLLGITFFTHGWTIGVMFLTIASLFIKDVSDEKRKTIPLISLRGTIVLLFTFGLCLSGYIFSYFQSGGLSKSLTAENTSSSLIVISSIYFLAVIASNALNSYMSNLVMMIKKGADQTKGVNLPYEVQMIENEIGKLAKTLKGERDDALSKSNRLAHDIRAPLGALNFAASNIDSLSKLEDLKKEDLNDVSQVISNVNRTIRQLSQDILNERKQKFNNETVRSSILDSVEMVKVGKSHAEFEVDGIENLPERCVPGLTIVLTNLLNNSVESNSKNPRVSVNAKVYNDEILLRISDNGNGIPKDLLEKLRKGESHTTKTDGNGIGLSSAIEWAETSGLKFDISSVTEGSSRGTTIELGIPS